MQELIDQLAGYLAEFGLLFVFAGIFLDNFGLPSASEVLVFLAAALAAQGEFSLAAVAATVTAAAVASDQALYWVARTGVRRLALRFIPAKAVAAGESFYARHGPKALVIARFLPAIRTEVTFIAGLSVMPYRRFLAWDLLGIAVWLAVLLPLGWAFAESIDSLAENYAAAVRVAMVVLGAAVAAWVTWWLVRRRRQRDR